MSISIYVTEEALLSLTTAELRHVVALAVGRFFRLGAEPMPSDPSAAAKVSAMADQCMAIAKSADNIIRARA